jgi:hypothetical protein
MSGVGSGYALDPDWISKTVAIGGYVLDVGAPMGMAISSAGEAAAQGAEQARLSSAIAQEDKDEARHPDGVDKVEASSERAEDVTDQVERADKLWMDIATGRLEVGDVNNEIDTLLALLQKLDRAGS